MSKIAKVVNVSVLLAFISIAIYGFINIQNIRDFLALRGYVAPARITEIASNTSMNEKTKKVFFVNRPSLESKANFSGVCSQREETIVLGCFISNKGIFLLDVDDPRLHGIVEVTAGHEVLHAMYARLSPNEKKRVDKMTEDFFSSIKDERIRQNIENYRKSDPSVVPNELHSILGTEVRDLPPELENYYAKYFKNRAAIVGFSEKYEQTFIDIENQVKNYDLQLKSLKIEIDNKEKEIESIGSQIDQKRKTMDELLKNQRVAEYNSNVESFNALVNKYNSLIKVRQNQAKTYNQIVDEYNKLATTETDLINALKTDDIKPVSGAQ